DDSILARVPRSLPAVLEADQLTQRAARIGFDWDDVEGIFEKIDEERREILSAIAEENRTGKEKAGDPTANGGRLEEETGDLLFAAVNVARFLGINPELALKKANRKFRERILSMEDAARREGRNLAELPRAQMEKLWDESKSGKAAGRSE